MLSLRDFQDDKADVIQKYTSDEARNLKVGSSSSILLSCKTHAYDLRSQAYGELPETAKLNETDAFGGEEECVPLHTCAIHLGACKLTHLLFFPSSFSDGMVDFGTDDEAEEDEDRKSDSDIDIDAL